MTVGIMLFAKFCCILMSSSKVYQRLRMTSGSDTREKTNEHQMTFHYK